MAKGLNIFFDKEILYALELQIQYLFLILEQF